jgi:hypothetical protein
MAGLGDRVAIRHTTAGVSGLSSIIDVDAFRQRLEEIDVREELANPYKEYIHTFLQAWRKKQSGQD